jgi:type I restriction enzyme, S subunit
MMGWPVVELGEVAAQVARPETPLPGSAYRLIGVRLWGKGAYERGTIDGSETKYSSLYKNLAGDIIVNKIWARNGSVAVVDPELDGTFGSSEFPTYLADESKLLPDWFRYFTLTSKLWAQCDKLSRGTSGQNRLRPEQFLGVRIPLPPLDEQRRIVEKLDRVAALVDERRSAIEAAERETQALLLKAFQRAIDGAPLRPMAEVAPLVRRPVEIDLDASYPELGVRSFGRGTFHKPDLPGAEVGNKKLFRICAGDLLFNIVFAWEGAVAVAQPEDEGRVGSHRFLSCVPAPETATVEFLRFYFSTPEGLQKLGEASPGGAGRNRTLGLKKLESLQVPVPQILRQHWFDRLQAKAREARAIRASTAQDVEALIPAMLHEIFDGGAKAA